MVRIKEFEDVAKYLLYYQIDIQCINNNIDILNPIFNLDYNPFFLLFDLIYNIHLAKLNLLIILIDNGFKLNLLIILIDNGFKLNLLIILIDNGFKLNLLIILIDNEEIEFLLDQRTDINTDDEEKTLLTYALSNGSYRIENCRVLDYAVEKKNINIIKNLLNCGIDEIDINTFFNIKYYNNEEKKI
ncbi:hypothetical protein H8356DRAFT_1330218 [Neocallimastix lanati (nom. inval.)]|nr:hypothetical protein H8356DRAFT_1330218 [Neocallimastix sp. JGI-2020a]